MYDLEFVSTDTGRTIGTAPRERAVPMVGAIVTLEHAVLGPVIYRVAGVDFWYRSRTGRLAQPDQYIGAGVKIYLAQATRSPR